MALITKLLPQYCIFSYYADTANIFKLKNVPQAIVSTVVLGDVCF